MLRNILRVSTCLSTLFLGVGVAYAQTPSFLELPKLSGLSDENGVDLVTGEISVSSQSIELGDGDSSHVFKLINTSSSGWRNNYDLGVYRATGDDGIVRYTVSHMGGSTSFLLEQGVYRPERGDGNQLVSQGSSLIFTTKSGDVYSFNKNSPCTQDMMRGYLSNIVQSNGSIININWKSSGSNYIRVSSIEIMKVGCSNLTMRIIVQIYRA